MAALVAALTVAAPAQAQLRLLDDTDRAAFRAWFTFLADAEFARRSADVTDCAGLVRHAFREALRPHSAEWRRLNPIPGLPAFADVRQAPRPTAAGWPLFRVSLDPNAIPQEFADARTIIRTTRPLGWDPAGVRLCEPPTLNIARSPDGVRLAAFEPTGTDCGNTQRTTAQGEVRSRSRARRAPLARWRPVAANFL